MSDLGGGCGGLERRVKRMLPLAALLAVMALSACGGGRIEVDRMAVLPPDTVKTTFVMVRAKSQDHSKSYPKFADRIAEKLAAKGFSRVDAASQAKYAVMFSYDGDGMAGASDGGRHGMHDKKGEGKVERMVSIALFDLSRPDQPDEKVFGGRAKCTTETANPDAVISALIDAILKDFPGKAHETYSTGLPDID